MRLLRGSALWILVAAALWAAAANALAGGDAEGSGKTGIAALPLPARFAVSSVIGRDDDGYRAKARPGGYAFENPAQRLSATFTDAGLDVRSGDAEFRLVLTGWGYGESIRDLGKAAPTAAGNRVEYRRGILTEWHVNGPLGLQQGFTLQRPPETLHGGPLTLALTVAATASTNTNPSLTIGLDQDARGLTLSVPNSGPALRYDGLLAYDTTGHEPPAWMAVADGEVRLRMDDADAAYPLVVDPFIQQSKLIASDGAGGDEFGRSVAISGDTVVVGARRDNIGDNSEQGSASVLTPVVTNVFADVANDYWAVAWINQLYADRITGGCGLDPLEYCPDSYVTRAQMAAFLLRAKHGFSYSPPASGDIFSDVPAAHWAKNWINQLYAEGITGGCGQSQLRYCPDSYVTRTEMAAFLLRTKHGSSYSPPVSGDIFSDVPAAHWAKNWVNQLYAEGISSGCGQSPLRYCPDSYVTRAQMAIFLLRVTRGTTYRPPAIAYCRMFPFNNIWNHRVNSLPVHPRSDQWIDSIGRSTGFHMDFGAGTWAGGPIGIPYNYVNGSQVTQYTVDFYYPTESDPGPYPIPSNPLQEYGSDHHILIIDQETCTLYELYDASFNTSGWSAGSGAIWDLNSNALRPTGWTSADAAGLPILPGLIRYDEITAGAINHAIRFTAGATNSYIWPARHLTSGSPGTLTSTPPMGAIFRLKASYDTSGFPPEMQVILTAMKRYGIILADNGSDWYLSGAPDERWDNDMLHLLDVLTGSDFEAVDTAGLIVEPNSGATP